MRTREKIGLTLVIVPMAFLVSAFLFSVVAAAVNGDVHPLFSAGVCGGFVSVLAGMFLLDDDR